jgi:hypothetical protein
MIRNRVLLKSFTIFFLLEISLDVFAPAFSWALTGGPTSPEFSSFEPVDTTDMVNLATGDFVYNTPILEVPGPEGGYPLSLSYHAGIKTEQESSWVGLGFTLSPGAINRSLNGYADDNNQTITQIRDYWGGGKATTETRTYGLSALGITPAITTTKTNDTYKGFSCKTSFGISVDPVQLGLSAASMLAKKGFSTTKPQPGKNSAGYESVQRATLAYTAMGHLGISANLDFSISSGSVKSNLTVAGINVSQHNNYAGKITSRSSSRGDDFNFSYLGIAAQYSKHYFSTKYWSDEAQSIYTFGSLYPGVANQFLNTDHYEGSGEFITYASDSYDLYDAFSYYPQAESDANDPNDPERQMGGTLPAFDQYNVLGQGISGLMQPHIFENGDLYGQAIYERNLRGNPAIDFPTLQYKSLRPFSDKKVDFRFLNDFSNSLTLTPGQFSGTDDALTSGALALHVNSDGFNNQGQNLKLAGSKHIEWYTTEEIINGDATTEGFMDAYPVRSDRRIYFEITENYLQPEEYRAYSIANVPGPGSGVGAYTGKKYQQEVVDHPVYPSPKISVINLSKKIGGFKVTNESGVTYHYALPVYNYNEYTRTRVRNPKKGAPTFKESFNNEPYASTWLLTAITGPDFVDTNSNGTLDDGDWGYWVKFDYGRWADAYQWRTPQRAFDDSNLEDVSGYNPELGTESFSYGIKELYYLDAIETRSHKAIFIKSKRKDGRGVTSRLEGGSSPRRFKMDVDATTVLDYNVSPVSVMKLDAIYLFKKDVLATIDMDKTRGEKYMQAPSSNPYIYGSGEKKVVVKYHNGDLVYDDDDIHDLPEFQQKALRTIKFNTDYSLCPGVANSIGNYGDFLSCSGISTPCTQLGSRVGTEFEWPYVSSERLNDMCYFPSAKCCADNDLFYSYKGVFTYYANTGTCVNAGSDKKFTGEYITYYKTGKLTLNSIKTLGQGGADLLPPISFEYTGTKPRTDPKANPEYNTYKSDEWGYYKKDASTGAIGQTKNITNDSAPEVDVWSLTDIITPLGARFQIEYEPNDYKTSVYNNFSLFGIEDMITGTDNNIKIVFRKKNIDLKNWFKVGDPIDLNGLEVYQIPNYNRVNGESFSSDANDHIVSIAPNIVTIQSARLKEILTQKKTFTNDPFLQWIQVKCNSVFVSGFVKATDPEINYNGGIRVRSISIVDNSLRKGKTLYDYTSPLDGKSSGVTSYKLFDRLNCQFPANNTLLDDFFSKKAFLSQRDQLLILQADLQQLMNTPVEKILALGAEIPSPGSIYEYVSVHNFVDDMESDGYSTYHFKVFNEDMLEKTSTGTDDMRRTVVLKNNAIDVGNLLSEQNFDQQHHLLKSRTYNYLYDDDVQSYEQNLLDLKQGVVEQSFHKHIVIKKFKNDTDLYNFLERNFAIRSDAQQTHTPLKTFDKALITKREDRSNVLTGVKEIDYKLGITAETQNLGFDFFTGQVVKSVITDSYGNRFMSVNEPAYTRYPAMGLKIFNPNNAHMLTQNSATYSYKVNDSNTPVGLLSSTVQTWSDQVPVMVQNLSSNPKWRKQSSYTWDGEQSLNSDGTYPYNDFAANSFNWSNPDANSNWLKISELTLVDNYSHELEGKDVNGNMASQRFDNNHMNVIAVATNAAYNEMAYSGAEDTGNSKNVPDGGVLRNDGAFSPSYTHTGKYSLMVGGAQTGFSYTLKSSTADLTKKYRASVWVYAAGETETQADLNRIELFYHINNGTTVAVHPTLQKSKSKHWYVMNLDVVPDGVNDIVIGVRNNASRAIYFDDFRVHPLNASMLSYVYDDADETLDYILDQNNFYTHFEYDAMGRLVRTSKELLNYDYGDGKESYKPDAIVKEMKYNYGNK